MGDIALDDISIEGCKTTTFCHTGEIMWDLLTSQLVQDNVNCKIEKAAPVKLKGLSAPNVTLSTIPTETYENQAHAFIKYASHMNAPYLNVSSNGFIHKMALCTI